jgi:hypothetical protein
MAWLEDSYDSRRTLGIRDREILYRTSKGRCQNPGCGKKIDFDEMQVGHRTTWARGSRTTLNNSVCLCYRCKKLQGTDSLAVLISKRGVADPQMRIEHSLQALRLDQLKSLAQKHSIQVKGAVSENWFDSTTRASTKSQYISKLVGVVSEKEVDSLLQENPKGRQAKDKKPR